MKHHCKWIAIGLLISLLQFSTVSNAMSQPEVYSGIVTSVSEGSLYLGGITHAIATVNTEQGAKRVAISTMGVMQPLQVGESLSFSGTTITVNSEQVINTKDGFLFRPSEKSMAAFMADMQAQAQAQMEKAAKSGIPNAVPTMLLESPEQAQEAASKRRTDLLLTVMSVVLALLAFERIQQLTKAPVRWVKSRFRKERAIASEEAAQQQVPRDAASPRP